MPLRKQRILQKQVETVVPLTAWSAVLPLPCRALVAFLAIRPRELLSAAWRLPVSFLLALWAV